MTSLRLPGALFLSGWFAASALAATPPKLEHLYPVAGQRGTTVSVTATGKFDPWPPQVWVDAPGIVFKPAANGKFEVEIANDAAPGPHLVRCYNESGTSAPRFFIVSDKAETGDTEPNDDFRAPQGIPELPVTLGGRLDKGGDVDSFGVTLKRGERLVAWVEAYVLASAFDGMLRVIDGNGIQLAFNHDGRTLDPFLAWEAPYDGTFIVQLMGFVYPASSEVRFAGGEGGVYRLHLTTGPVVRYSIPAVAERGKKQLLELVGWNLAAASVEVDATSLPPEATTMELPVPALWPRQSLLLSDIPEWVERDGDLPQPIELPAAITGRIDPANDEDRFQFTAVKQRVYDFRLTAVDPGSPLDAWLRIENSEGKEVGRNDDAAGSRDPRITWTAPADGVYRVAVGDLSHHGDRHFVYRFEMSEAAPSIAATLADSAVSLQAGKGGEIKVSIKRLNGFNASLKLFAKNLPEGVSAPEMDVPEKGGEVSLAFSASPEAKPVSQPIQVGLRETASGREHTGRFMMTTTGEDNGVPQGYSDLVIDSTDQIWLTVSK